MMTPEERLLEAVGENTPVAKTRDYLWRGPMLEDIAWALETIQAAREVLSVLDTEQNASLSALKHLREKLEGTGR